MKQGNSFSRYLMILIAICSLTLPTPVSSFTVPHRIRTLFSSPYSKATCLVLCTYFAVRTLGYLINDTVKDEEEKSETESEIKNKPQEASWQNNPISLACITSVVGAVTHVITHTTLSAWSEKTDITKFTSIEDKAKYCKSIDELIGSPQEAATKIYKSIISRHKDNRPTTNWLLHGPPGCGKTDLARAVARKLYEEIEADALFIKGSSFNTQYSGQGAAKVDALFKEAIRRTKNNTKPVIMS